MRSHYRRPAHASYAEKRIVRVRTDKTFETLFVIILDGAGLAQRERQENALLHSEEKKTRTAIKVAISLMKLGGRRIFEFFSSWPFKP